MHPDERVEREKEESKVPPKIDHPPTAATGEITKCWQLLMMGGEGCVGRLMRWLCVCGGIFIAEMSVSFYIYCLFYAEGGWCSFFPYIYGDLVIYEEGKKEA